MSKGKDLLPRKEVERLFAEVEAKDKTPPQPSTPAIHVTHLEVATRDGQEAEIVRDEEYWISLNAQGQRRKR